MKLQEQTINEQYQVEPEWNELNEDDLPLVNARMTEWNETTEANIGSAFTNQNSIVQINEDYIDNGTFVKSGDFLHYCDKCDYKSNYGQHMKAHKKSKHEGITFPCDQCDYKSTFSHHLIRHKKRHTKK